MKIQGILVCSVFMSVYSSVGQGFETFQNFPSTSGSYTTGSFTGMDGSVWNYIQCRGDKYIESPTPCLGKRRNPLSKIVSGTICNGCRTLVFSYRQAFSTAVNLDLLVNGVLIRNVVSAGGYADTAFVYSSDSITIKQAGDFVIEFRQADSLNSGQVCIDNIFWTPFQQGVGIDEALKGDNKDKPVIFISLYGKRISVRCIDAEEKILDIYSLDGRLIREIGFKGPEADLQLEGCNEGICVAILSNKQRNIIANAKLLLK